jgi:hypothetical protein
VPTQEERGASAREAWEASTPPPLPAPVVPNGYFVLEPMSSSVALKASYRGGGCLAAAPWNLEWNGRKRGVRGAGAGTRACAPLLFRQFFPTAPASQAGGLGRNC